MKKHFLLACLMLPSMATMAQTVLWDGENQAIGSQGGLWGDGSPVVVANPDQSGINPSAQCLRFTMTGTSKVVKIPFSVWIKPNLAGNRRISLMLKRSGNDNVQIELSDPTDGSTGYWVHNAAWYGSAGQWQKVVFDLSANTAMNDFPGVMAITACTGDVTADETVYIDNVVVEPIPTVNGRPLSTIADGSLTGALTLGGSWMQGESSNTDNAWAKVSYNDFATLAAKISPTVTSIDMRGTIVKDAYNAYANVNPNILIYADQSFGDFNVVANGKTSKLNLNEGYAFNAPEGFAADSVTVTRALADGNNTVCLPFATTAAELGATNIATFKATSTSGDVATVTFDIVQNAVANTPVITDGAAASTEQSFSNKTIEPTPATLGTDFIGVYAPQSAQNLWGINNKEFKLGGADATINAFHAYLSVPSAAKSLTFSIGDATAITKPSTVNDALVDVYTLSGAQVKGQVTASDATAGLAKGIYIVNQKKIIVK